jgi:hypothetical protein
VAEGDVSRTVDWAWGADCMASSVAGSNSYGVFLWRPLREQVYAVRHRTIEDFVARLEAALTRWGVFETMRRGALPSAWKWTPVVTTRPPWFDHLTAFAIWRRRESWKLYVIGHMLCNIFDFLRRITLGRACVRISFHAVCEMNLKDYEVGRYVERCLSLL